MKKIRGIFCMNCNCKHYFEDNCMLIWETDTVHISSAGRCEDFESGKHIGYIDEFRIIEGIEHKEVKV